MTMPDKRLFSVNAGQLGLDGIPDPRLRDRTDQAALAIFKLMRAAGLQGQLTPVHAAENGMWVLHIDADATIFEALELFEEKPCDPVTPEDAGKRITDNAVREIRRFMEAQQPANLVFIERAAQKFQSQAGADNAVVSALRQEPGQRMNLQT